jgi:cytochrome c biogenesis protein CcmG, thiol:disulfide interchange protein DsbE
MKNLLSLLVIMAFAAGIRAQDQPSSSKEAARKLPAVDVKTPESKIINTETFSNDGKPIVICFWATWCKPCIEELNAINEHYEEWQKESGVKVIAISIDDARTLSRVGPFANGKNWEYEIYVDPNGDFKRAMNVNMPPQSFVLNKDREIVWTHVSYTPGDEKKLHEVINKVAAGLQVN